MINKVGKLVKPRFSVPLVFENKNGGSPSVIVKFCSMDDTLLITDVLFVEQESHDVRRWSIGFLSLGGQWVGFSSFLDNIPTHRAYFQTDVYQLSFQELI